MSNSPKYSLNSTDLGKIGKGAVVVMLGAILTYLSSIIPNIDFGVWTPVVVAGWTVVVDILRRYLTDYTSQKS